MFALDAKRMGYSVIVLDPHEHSPCGQVADAQYVAAYDDLDAIDRLGEACDVVTFEFENISIESVKRLEANGKYVTPGSSVLKITQNRLLEKQFVRDAGVAVTPFARIDRIDDFVSAGTTVGYPAILKTVRGGYDGKGQWRIDSATPARAAFAEAKGEQLIMERFVPFEKELSVVAARNAAGDVVTFPVAENEHDNGILSMSIVPARVSPEITKRAQELTATIARALKIVGVFCVEYFLTPQGELLVNEIAPRPHNSGHYSMDAMPCSQYEQHIRAICGLPLAPPRLLTKAVMMNILGAGTGDHLHGIEQLLQEPALVLHVYGKKHAVARRKMGHFTVLCDGLDAGIARAKAGLEKLHWA